MVILNAQALLVALSLVAFVPPVVCQPFVATSPPCSSQSNSSGESEIDTLMDLVIKDHLNHEPGFSAARVDIGHYNTLIANDPGSCANKIDESTTAAFLFYTHKGFHNEALMKSSSPVFGKMVQAAYQLDLLTKQFIDAFSSIDYEDVKMEYFSLPYLEGSFSHIWDNEMKAEIENLKSIGKYYDPVKAGVATGEFQYIKPSDSMMNQWTNGFLMPICLHRSFGGWFQFAAIMLIAVPNNPSSSVKRLYQGYHPQFVSPSDARYFLLAYAMEDTINDAWRDYPFDNANAIRYELQAYTWEKSGMYYDHDEHPFVQASKISFAFHSVLSGHPFLNPNLSDHTNRGPHGTRNIGNGEGISPLCSTLSNSPRTSEYASQSFLARTREEPANFPLISTENTAIMIDYPSTSRTIPETR